MYIVVTDSATYQATTDVGALAQINDLPVDSIRCFAGPWRGDAAAALREAFPDAVILTNQPVPAGLSRCYYLPSAEFVSFTSPRMFSVVGVKGGVGKTTFSALAAFCLSKIDVVCVVDRDEQAGFTTMCNIASNEEKYDVRYVAQRILLVPNRRGDAAPMSDAPADIIGASLGASFVIADCGNNTKIPNRENTILVTGIGEDIFRQTVPLLHGFRGVVAVMPIHNEGEKCKAKMVQKIVDAGISPHKVISLPFLPLNPWRPLFLQIESVIKVQEVYKSVMEVLRAAGLAESSGKDGSYRGKGRFLGL